MQYDSFIIVGSLSVWISFGLRFRAMHFLRSRHRRLEDDVDASTGCTAVALNFLDYSNLAVVFSTKPARSLSIMKGLAS